MKPERIQLTAERPRPIEADSKTPTWGLYQVLDFTTFGKAQSFAGFVGHMAENHGLEVSCTIDVDKRVTLLVAADAPADDAGEGEATLTERVAAQLVRAEKFVAKVDAMYRGWSFADVELS